MNLKLKNDYINKVATTMKKLEKHSEYISEQ